jgi:two-component system LytT family response regulator
MKVSRAIIVDDEEDARDVLNTLIELSEFPVEIIAKCSNLKDAVSEIKRTQPDVVFLDIQMPQFAGFEIVNFFDEINFEIIFVTAFDKYALKAFELSAVDYLVKPINRSRLDIALKRIGERVGYKDSILEYKNLLDSMQNEKNDKIVIPEMNSNRILNLKDIVCIQGHGSYTIVYLENKEKLTVSKNLKYFENILSDNQRFFRSQKSWIINMECVQKFNSNQ